MIHRQARLLRVLLTWIGCFIISQPLLSQPIEGAAMSKPSAGPNIVLVTVDTLRVDRVSAYGYERSTTPNVDALLNAGARFSQARVPEPLTAPAMGSMLTSLHPHEHGATRNGLRMRPGLDSLPSILASHGYKTAAFVGNWTLKDQISGIGEHFMDYVEVFSRKRWFGLWFGEATAEDLTQEAFEWIENHLETSRRPFLIWIHFVEPHAPYRFHQEFASDLGIRTSGNVSASDRYDTEIAFVDKAIGHFVDRMKTTSRSIDPLIVFAADHGESLGEHGYWGHGRHLFDATLHVPLGLTWHGKVNPQVIDAPASILDISPTLLGLAGVEVALDLQGFDWSGVLQGASEIPNDRITLHQAHKGAVQGRGNTNARRQGLLEVGRIENQKKEILRVKNGQGHWLFDLLKDPEEIESLTGKESKPSAELVTWLELVKQGLAASDELPPPVLDEESLDRLRALGYID